VNTSHLVVAMAATNAFLLIRNRLNSTNNLTNSVTLDESSPSFEPEKQLTRFKLDSIDYMRKSEVASLRKARDKKSPVWRFGEALVRLNDKKEVYYCYQCEREGKKQKLPVLNGNKGGLDHLTYHKRDPKTGELNPVIKGSPMTTFYSLVDKKDFNTFKELLIHWFVWCQLAFFMVENQVFRELIAYLNEGLALLLPRARSTLRQWIMDEYLKQKAELKAELSLSLSRIHLAFDIWTASNRLGYLSVWAYWIDSNGNQQRKLIAFRRIFSSHSGDNQAEVLLDIIKELGFERNVGYFVSDNASSNDSAVELALIELYPGITPAQINERRLRCLGHIINLAAKSLLSPTNAEKEETKEELELVDVDYFMINGPLGKLYRLISYILGSSLTFEEFGELKGGRKVVDFDHLALIASNATRWNSQLKAIGRAINVRERLMKFIKTHKPPLRRKYKPQSDRLTPSDWQYLERLHSCLETFYAATMLTEGHKSDLSDWFTTLHHLLREIDEWKTEASEVLQDDYLVASLTASWNKIEKYYKKVDETPVYYAAIVLNPTLKLQWFRENWTSIEERPWITQIEVAVKELWRRDYKKELQKKTTTAPSKQLDEDAFARLANCKRLKLVHQTDALEPFTDQLDSYLATDPVVWLEDTKFNVQAYWYERRFTQPQLARFAFDVFSIPLMSDDNERSFSSSKNMITDLRNRLRPNIIEACQCLKSWNPPKRRYQEPLFDDEDEIEEDYEKAGNNEGAKQTDIDVNNDNEASDNDEVVEHV
jgi:hypothetical protein